MECEAPQNAKKAVSPGYAMDGEGVTDGKTAGRRDQRALSVSREALVGFQGRECAEVVPPDFSHPLLLEPLLFQWPSKSVTLLERDGSRRPRNPIRASHVTGTLPVFEDLELTAEFGYTTASLGKREE